MNYFDIGYSIKDQQKSYFEALTKKNYRSSFWVYKETKMALILP
jgi:hypothetical protein